MNLINFAGEFFSNNVADIALVAIFTLGLCWLWRTGHEKRVYQIVYALVVKAEKELGSKTGQMKYNMVISELYKALPLAVRFFFTQDNIDFYIQEALKALKTELLKGVDLKGLYTDEAK